MAFPVIFTGLSPKRKEMRFKAAILVESKKPLVLEEIEINPLEVGQVLVKLDSSGVCGAQINEIDAVKGKDRFLPHLLGHEGHGEVMECGGGVSKVRCGDKVVLHWRRSEGINSSTPSYSSKSLGKINAGWVTTFNEYAVVSEDRITPLSISVQKDHAALLGCAVTTAMGTLVNDAKVRVGDSIAIFGCGGVGLSLVQFAKLAGCFPIVAIDIYEDKLEVAREIGATHIINSSNKNFLNLLLQANQQTKYDICIDNTGLPHILKKAYETTSPEGGRTVMVGVMDRKDSLNIWTYPLHFNQELIGSSGGQCNPAYDIPKIVKLLDEKILDLNQLIGATYTLDQINDAIDDLRFGSIPGRLMISL